MAAFVITPTGEMFEYPTASYAVRSGSGKTELYVDNTKKVWVTDAPVNWCVGWSRPRVLGAGGADLAKIKRALRNFDARTGRFKD